MVKDFDKITLKKDSTYTIKLCNNAPWPSVRIAKDILVDKKVPVLIKDKDDLYRYRAIFKYIDLIENNSNIVVDEKPEKKKVTIITEDKEISEESLKQKTKKELVSIAYEKNIDKKGILQKKKKSDIIDLIILKEVGSL